MSPADLKALCQEAALAAMARTGSGRNGPDAEAAGAVTHDDFVEALKRVREGSVAETASF